MLSVSLIYVVTCPVLAVTSLGALVVATLSIAKTPMVSNSVEPTYLMFTATLLSTDFNNVAVAPLDDCVIVAPLVAVIGDVSVTKIISVCGLPTIANVPSLDSFTLSPYPSKAVYSSTVFSNFC